jgi:uncharacterized protein (TIGR00299 family) protein
MRIAYLDAFSGICGDMTLGAFVSAGMPLEALQRGFETFGPHGCTITAREVRRGSIAAVKVDIDTGAAGGPDSRPYTEIMAMLERGALGSLVKERSTAIFRRIGEAEARLHGVPLERVHLHELGAMDSILDVVGTALCLEYFSIDRVYSSRIRTGSGGMVRTRHGEMPIPTPAALEILKGYPIEPTAVEHELTTPTGAGIVAGLSAGLLPEDAGLTVERIGYGAGGRDIPGMPNMLRVVIGELELHTLQQ